MRKVCIVGLGLALFAASATDAMAFGKKKKKGSCGGCGEVGYNIAPSYYGATGPVGYYSGQTSYYPQMQAQALPCALPGTSPIIVPSGAAPLPMPLTR